MNVLIGPRPTCAGTRQLFRKYSERLCISPSRHAGHHRLAQCNGARDETPIEHIAERVKLDLWYINNWSLGLDIQIFIKTFFEILRKRNAY
ncbi:sugar transferase [Bradyrhizobium sp. 200]|nr:sugar transferase [Bradyrhizobium sp. 200]